MNDESHKSERASQPNEFKLEIDPKLESSFQGGMDALQKVFSGFVQTIKTAVGPDVLRNLEVGNWLEQLASCLDQVATSLRTSGCVPSEKSGELGFFIEQWDAELKGSKFEAQQGSMRQRLDQAVQAARQVTSDNAAHAATQVSEAAGYFHAAAKTVQTIQVGKG